MKPLERGRRTLIWMGIQFADDEPLKGRFKLTQIVTSTSYAILFIAFSSLHLVAFLQLETVNPEEFFFVLLQLILSVHGLSAFITVYSYGSYITTVFQCLTEIYEKCKQFEHFSIKNRKFKNSIESFADPHDCLAKINEQFERIYGFSCKVMQKWIHFYIMVPSGVSVLLCYFRRGEFDVAYLLHSIRIR